MSSYAVITEETGSDEYCLDNKQTWEIGRRSSGRNPDIILNEATASRKQGRFQNMDGVWFYIDYSSKNGTAYNGKDIVIGINGRTKPVMLKDGDILNFGGKSECTIMMK